MQGKFFEGVAQTEFDLKGFKIKIPLFYYDSSIWTAVFTASSKKVKRYLPHPNMRPIEIFPGRCFFLFVALEHRKTDVGPYNEFMTAIPITFKKPQIPGLTFSWQTFRQCFTIYVLHMPVTSEIAMVGGIDILGLPKFMPDIIIQKEKEWIECSLSEGGNNILKLKLKNRSLPKKRVLSKFIMYSILGGFPLRTNTLLNSSEYIQNFNKKNVRLEIGAGHNMCDELRNIGLSKTSLAHTITTSESIAFPGRNLRDK